jgi:glucan phosphoethanolaminetransferase (alkaline phosphatase superfamily)
MVLPQVGGRVGRCQLIRRLSPTRAGPSPFYVLRSPLSVLRSLSLLIILIQRTENRQPTTDNPPPMPSTHHLYQRFELLWWAITILATGAVLAPVIIEVKDYPLYLLNILFIITFLTLTRYIFLLHLTFLARRQRLKVALVFLCIPFIFYLVEQLNGFQDFLDTEGAIALVESLPAESQAGMAFYIQNQMLLFGVGSIISAVLFPLRLVVSVWRNYNKGTV